MATKRPAGAHDIHPSRQTQVPRDAPRKRLKPNNLSGSKSFKKARPVNELKTSIRNIRRLLERDGVDKEKGQKPLPPKIRISKERELASAQHELAESQAAERRSKMIARYHKVRFFDRQKATKRLKRAKKAMKEVESDAQKREELAKEVDECELDVQYAMFYPLDVPYVALYPSAKKEEGKTDAEDGKVVEVQRQGDAEMRALLKKCVSEGKLDALRNGKLDKEGDYKAVEEPVEEAPKPKKQSKSDGKEEKNGKRKAEEMEPAASDDGDDSDGGFFE